MLMLPRAQDVCVTTVRAEAGFSTAMAYDPMDVNFRRLTPRIVALPALLRRIRQLAACLRRQSVERGRARRHDCTENILA